MEIQIIERSKLLNTIWAKDFSDTTLEAIVQIIENIRETFGHDKAEETAKEIQKLIENEIGETELLKNLMLNKWCKCIPDGRSAILIIRSLSSKTLQESTVQQVLSIILDTKKKYGATASEQIASLLKQIVDDSENEEQLLQSISQIKIENSWFK